MTRLVRGSICHSAAVPLIGWNVLAERDRGYEIAQTRPPRGDADDARHVDPGERPSGGGLDTDDRSVIRPGVGLDPQRPEPGRGCSRERLGRSRGGSADRSVTRPGTSATGRVADDDGRVIDPQRSERGHDRVGPDPTVTGAARPVGCRVDRDDVAARAV